MSRDLFRALAFVRPYRRHLAFVGSLSLASSLIGLYLPYLSKDLVDRALLGGEVASLVRVVVVFVAATLVSFVLNASAGLRYTRVAAEMLFEMRLALYRHLQALSPRFYASARLGDLLSRLNSDLAEIHRVLVDGALMWVGHTIGLVGTVAILLWLDWRLFLVSLAALPPAFWLLVRYRGALEARTAEVRRRNADVGSFLVETLQGLRLVVASNAEAREAARFRQLSDRGIDALVALRRASYLASGVPGVLLAFGTAVVFLYGGLRVIGGSLTLGTFAAFVTYEMRLVPALQGLLGVAAALAAVRVSLARVYEVLDTPPEVVEPPSPVRLARVGGAIEFRQVTVRYGRGAPALDRVSLRVRPGETVAIVGPSGSGKSTVADLLLRLIDPDEGSVWLDGYDLRTLALADIRRHVALVDQDPVVFHTSVAENVRYACPEASDAAVATALERAGLAAWLATLPEGARTIVGERGRALSAGERQRLAIARAFLADPAVLILDEATSALDPEAERHIIAGYRALMRGRTTLIITHRFALARQAERVVVLEGARLVEEGPPDRLLAEWRTFARLFGPSASVGSPS